MIFTRRLALGSLLIAASAVALACGASSTFGGDLPVEPEVEAGGGGVDPDGPDGAPKPGDDASTGPVAFAVGQPVVIVPSGFVLRGITAGGDVILERDDGGGRKSAHAVPLAGGAPTQIEGNLDTDDSEIDIEGHVVVIRKAPPTSRTGGMTVWTRATGLKDLGTVVRHYGGFAASPDGKRIAYVSGNEIRLGPPGSAVAVANNVNAQSEDCTPQLEFQGEMLVTSTCVNNVAKGDLRTFDAAGKARSIAPAGTLGYNGFSFAGTTTHLLYDTGGVGSALHLVDLGTGTDTTIDSAGSYSGARLSADAKVAIYRSSSRDELRKWQGGSSAQFADRTTAQRYSNDMKWVAATRVFPQPSKLRLIEVATGTTVELADNAYASGFVGDDSGFFYSLNSVRYFYDIAKKAPVSVGRSSMTPLPGRSEVLAIECPPNPEFDTPVCALNVIDTKTMAKTLIDETVTQRMYREDHHIAYVKGTSVVVRKLDF